jgi:hypothetical protein
MNRLSVGDFHGADESSFRVAVDGMWKLCNVAVQSQVRQSYRGPTEEFGTDFSHELFGEKPLRARRL